MCNGTAQAGQCHLGEPGPKCRKPNWVALESKPESSFLPWSLFHLCPQVPALSSALTSLRGKLLPRMQVEIILSFPRCFWSWRFTTSIVTLTRTPFFLIHSSQRSTYGGLFPPFHLTMLCRCAWKLSPTAWALEHLVPSWWPCLGRCRWRSLAGGSRSLGTGFERKALHTPLAVHSLYAPFALEDVSSQLPVAARPATHRHAFPLTPRKQKHQNSSINCLCHVFFFFSATEK